MIALRTATLLVSLITAAPLFSQHRSETKFYADLLREQISDAEMPVAFTSGTSIGKVCQIGRYSVVHYANINPSSQHEHRALLIFKDQQYLRYYAADETRNCRCDRLRLRCDSTFFPDLHESVALKDLLTGRTIVIGAAVSPAFPASRRGRR